MNTVKNTKKFCTAWNFLSSTTRKVKNWFPSCTKRKNSRWDLNGSALLPQKKKILDFFLLFL